MPLLFAFLTLATNSPVLTVPIAPYVDTKQVWIDALANCESGGDPTIKVWDTNDRWSYGLLQFQMATWLTYIALSFFVIRGRRCFLSSGDGSVGEAVQVALRLYTTPSL